jgi:hypothetical protein
LWSIGCGTESLSESVQVARDCRTVFSAPAIVAVLFRAEPFRVPAEREKALIGELAKQAKS